MPNGVGAKRKTKEPIGEQVNHQWSQLELDGWADLAAKL
jgi:hypothetical protein